MPKTANDLLVRLAQTRILADARDIVGVLEHDYGFKWRALGDREGNYGSVNIGSDPGHAFVERVTNALDAIIEREALRRVPRGKLKRDPSSPREAVEDWFGVPGGRVANLEVVGGTKKGKGNGKVTRQQLADNVVIKIFDGVSKKQP